MTDEHSNLPARHEPYDVSAAGSAPGLYDPLPDEGGPGGAAAARRILAAVWRHKWLVLLVLLVGGLAGFGASRFIAPEYRAETTIWVEGRGAEDAGGPLRSQDLLSARGWVELGRSYTVLDSVVHDLNLLVRPAEAEDSTVLGGFEFAEEFRPGTYTLRVDDAGESWRLDMAVAGVVDRGSVGGPIGEELGFRWQPDPAELRPGRAIEFSVDHTRTAASRLAQQLELGMAQPNFMTLAMEGTDPEQLAETINAIADRFVMVAMELKTAQVRERTELLAEQLDSAHQNLQQSEVQYQNYRVGTITQPSERTTAVAPGLESTNDPVFANFFEQQFVQEDLQRDRQAILRALENQGSGTGLVTALEVIPSVRESSEMSRALGELTEKRANLRTLQQQYTDEHPEVQRTLQDVQALEQQTIPTLARSLVQEIDARIAQIGGIIASQSAELREIPQRAMEEARRERQMLTDAEIYNDLKGRYETARLAAATTAPDLRVLSEASIPQEPVTEGGTTVMLLSILGSLGLGILGAVMLDRVDPRVRYPDQVTHELGLPILGAIPHVGSQNGHDDSEKTEHVIEAFREVRMSLVHAAGSSGPLVLTVSSPGSGDGKSFIASNLALAFADLGHRTLLIDGDIRRGTIHRLFDTQRTPGLMDYIVDDDMPLEDIVQATTHPSLDMIGSGTHLREGPERLSSAALPELMAELRQRYGVILVDSPPLAAGVDAFVLGQLTGNMALVLRTGATNRELAEAKLDLLDRTPVRLLGAILNDVPPRGVYKYYGYLSGYTAGADAEDEPQRLQNV